MSACECGCGNATEGGLFLPGHDQALRTRLEAKVGGVLIMRELVTAIERYANGELNADELGSAVRQALARAPDGMRPGRRLLSDLGCHDFKRR